MKSISILLFILLIFIFMLTARTQKSITFTGKAQLPDGTVNKEYSYSFCKPDLKKINDLCGGIVKTTNPAGGQPPYHFELDSGSGFPPLGIILNTNGVLSGKAAKKGEYKFRVCVVDQAASKKCRDNILTIKEEGETINTLPTQPTTQDNSSVNPTQPGTTEVQQGKTPLKNYPSDGYWEGGYEWTDPAECFPVKRSSPWYGKYEKTKDGIRIYDMRFGADMEYGGPNDQKPIQEGVIYKWDQYAGYKKYQIEGKLEGTTFSGTFTYVDDKPCKYGDGTKEYGNVLKGKFTGQLISFD